MSICKADQTLHLQWKNVSQPINGENLYVTLEFQLKIEQTYALNKPDIMKARDSFLIAPYPHPSISELASWFTAQINALFGLCFQCAAHASWPWFGDRHPLRCLP